MSEKKLVVQKAYRRHQPISLVRQSQRAFGKWKRSPPLAYSTLIEDRPKKEVPQHESGGRPEEIYRRLPFVDAGSCGILQRHAFFCF